MKLHKKQKSLKHLNNRESVHDHRSCYHACSEYNNVAREIRESLPAREKLFNKVVTQSDIKHYRLAIPKHQVKKHFLQYLSTSSGGASLCMEDNEGQIWKFRLSFWKSCQGYMITQEWNRFVQRKSLKAGDTVTFLCSTGPEKRLFIESEPPDGLEKAQTPKPFEHTPKSAAFKLFGKLVQTSWEVQCLYKS